MSVKTYINVPVARALQYLQSDTGAKKAFLQRRAQDVRRSLDGTRAILSWSGNTPQIILDWEAANAQTIPKLTQAQAFALVQGANWTKAGTPQPVIATSFRARHGKKIAAGLVAAAAIGGTIAWFLLFQ